MSRIFSVVGAGPGQPGLLSARARDAICQAQEAYATGQIAGALAALRKDWQLCPHGQTAARAAESACHKVAVLVPGDPGFFEEIEHVRAILQPHGQVQVYPGVSSLQYLCARLGESYDDLFWMQAGDGPDLLAAVSYHSKVGVLTDDAHPPEKVCAVLHAAGLGRMRVAVGSRLGTGYEQIADHNAQSLKNKKFAGPSVVLLFQDHPADPLRPVFDEDLAGTDGMARQELRWNAASLLDVRPAETVYVLGAGNGASAVELARRAHEGRVYALEESTDKLEVLARNRELLGSWNILPVPGRLHEAMQPLSAPDAVLFGLRAHSYHGLLDRLKYKNPRVRVVIAAGSLDKLAEAQDALQALRYHKVAVSQLLLSRSRTMGGHTLMLGGETVFLLYAEG